MVMNYLLIIQNLILDYLLITKFDLLYVNPNTKGDEILKNEFSTFLAS